MNVMPKDFSAEVEFCWTFRNALKILYTIKPVTRAFTAMEKATPMAAEIEPQRVVWRVSSAIKVGPRPANHITRGN